MSVAMKIRARRVLIGCGLLLLGLIAVLALLEWGRQRQVAATQTTILDGRGRCRRA